MELDKSVGGLAGEGFERSTLWRALGRSVEMTGNGLLGGGAAEIWVWRERHSSGLLCGSVGGDDGERVVGRWSGGNLGLAGGGLSGLLCGGSRDGRFG